ncbi:MAG: hypothetical protein ABSC62_05590 [Terracidiphilus sp.]|jgi:hypothetical protein
MNLRGKLAGEIEDPVVAEALNNFKASVNAWSEAAYNRPRTVAATARYTWRLAASWMLGCVLVAGAAAGAVHERHQRLELARIAAIKAAAQKTAQKRAATRQSAPASAPIEAAARPTPANAKANKEDSDLLATVDSDVSREVPAAMEPLAQLVDENGTN